VKTVVGQGTFHWTPLISADVRFSVEKLSRTGVAALPKSESPDDAGFEIVVFWQRSRFRWR